MAWKEAGRKAYQLTGDKKLSLSFTSTADAIFSSYDY